MNKSGDCKEEDGDGSHLVAVSHSGHHDALVEGLWSFFATQHRVDFAFPTSGEAYIRAHRLILEIFLRPDKLGRNVQVPDENRPDSNIDLLFEFLYNGRVMVAREELDNLLKMAEELDFGMLADAVRATITSNRVLPRVAQKWMKRSLARRACHEVNEAPSADPSNTVKEQTCDVTAWIDHNYHIIEKKPDTASPEHKGSNSAPSEREPSSTSNIEGTVFAKSVERRPPPAGISSNVPREARQLNKPLAVTLQCPHCNWRTRQPRFYKLHVARHDPANRAFRCEICPRSFVSSGYLVRHRATHRSFKCPHCANFETPKIWSYQYHLFRQHGLNGRSQPARTIQCPDCDFKCKFNSVYLRHVSERHAVVKPVACEYPGCNFRAAYRGLLNKHVRAKHAAPGDAKPFLCETCGYQAVCPSHLRKHQSVHSQKANLRCDRCDKVYKCFTAFERHIRLHDNEYRRWFRCQLCRYPFERPYNLKVHMRTVHKVLPDQPIQPLGGEDDLPVVRCRLCPYVSVRQVEMKRHFREQHPGVGQFACDLCDYSARFPTHVRRHRLRHTGEKPYTCDACGWAFRNQSTFVRHQRLHCKGNAEKPFACHICGESFILLRYLKAHLRTVHEMIGNVGVALDEAEDDAVRAFGQEEALEFPVEMVENPNPELEIQVEFITYDGRISILQ